MKKHLVFYVALILIGAAWGLTFPISKIVVSTGYQPLGILVWKCVGAAILTGGFTLLRHRSLVLPRRHFGLFLGVAMLGILISGYLSFTAVQYIPAGVLAIVIALVPLFSMPIALMLGFEKPSALRLSGLIFGAAAVFVLMAPQASLPGQGKAIFILVAMGATLAYGAEGNFVAWFRQDDLDPVQVLFGASVVALVLAVPLALANGQFIDPTAPWGAPQFGILATSVLGTSAYAGYIWLIGRAGPVFAAQVSYLVAAFGVFWAMILLRETYSGLIWLALALMLVGLFLVRPRGAGAAVGRGPTARQG
ncbi:MAG: DMT family transporter [Paracoccaceae bacterium]